MNFDNIDLNILTYMCENGCDPYTVYEIACETIGASKKSQSLVDYRLGRLIEADIIIMAQDPINNRRYFKINEDKVFFYENYKMDLGFKEVDYGKTIVFDIDGDIAICHLEKDI